jgi:deoxyadenosine/deoxycytidine kinase
MKSTTKWIKLNLGKLLILDKDNLDFANNTEDMATIVN